ncbi:hypothetical protein ACWCYZ_05805 [Streptomyces virginiae]
MSACTACGADAVVQWRRLPTKDDLEQAAAFEAIRRAVRMAAAATLDETVAEEPPQMGGEVTVPVYACVEHALSPEAAAFVHEAACTGPGKGGTCGCTPPLPAFPFSEAEEAPQRRLPPGW